MRFINPFIPFTFHTSISTIYVFFVGLALHYYRETICDSTLNSCVWLMSTVGHNAFTSVMNRGKFFFLSIPKHDIKIGYKLCTRATKGSIKPFVSLRSYFLFSFTESSVKRRKWNVYRSLSRGIRRKKEIVIIAASPI
jgi:hypothetical protein